MGVARSQIPTTENKGMSLARRTYTIRILIKYRSNGQGPEAVLSLQSVVYEGK